MISYEEVLKAKTYTVVYTKENKKDKESVCSLYHITTLSELDAPS